MRKERMSEVGNQLRIPQDQKILRDHIYHLSFTLSDYKRRRL